MNQPSTPGHHHISTDEAVSRVVEWWNEGRPAGSRCDIVSGHAADEVLEEVHRRTPRSLLLDAAGQTPEEIVTEVLGFVGVPSAAQINTPWRHLRKYFSADTYILLKNAHRAESSRRRAHQVLSARMHDFPGVNIRLAREVADAAGGHIHLAKKAIDALFTFSAGLCIPLSMEITAAWWDGFSLRWRAITSTTPSKGMRGMTGSTVR
ncbi:hypothetical protein [Streptomyces lydicamycinicus]|uniref:hypothetical protein n=1 Tax=Streptomyces lydicamycinicus TaxID=1546107 RepID=UPI003C30C291